MRLRNTPSGRKHVPTLAFLTIFFFTPLTEGAELLTDELGCANIIPQDQSGYYTFFNPDTGKLTSAPPRGGPDMRLDPEDLYPFSTFHEGLTSTQTSEILTKLELQGRFQEGTIALVDQDGKTHIVHIGGEIFLSESGRCMRAAIIDRYRQGRIPERP